VACEAVLTKYAGYSHLPRWATVVDHVSPHLLRTEVLDYVDVEVGKLAVTTVVFGPHDRRQRGERCKRGEDRARDLSPVPHGDSCHVWRE